MVSLVARHYCLLCHNRVFPYDSWEAATLAPETGASGRPVLLYSANQRLSTDGEEERIAWCWACDGWTRTYRVTKADIALVYARRAGVKFRGGNGSERALVQGIEARVEARRHAR